MSRHLGGAKIATRDEMEERAIVATLTPCYHHPEPAMTEAYVQMCDVARQNGIAVYNGSSIRDSSVVHWSRNQLLGNLIKSKKPWTHVLFIDDDIVAQPDTLVKLIGHNKDIIAGVCTRRNDPPIPNIRHWQEEARNFQEIFEWGTEGLLEVGGVGTGLMLITKHALEQVADAWFHCKFEQEAYGMTPERAEEIMQARLERFDDTGIAMWFDFLPHLKRLDSQYGEDMSFCLMARRYCNIPIFVDTTVTPEHIGDYGYGVKDFLPYRKQVVEEYKNKLIFAAATGKELPPITKPEQENRKTNTVAVLIPSRGRREQLQETIDNLLAKAHGPIRILVRLDEDEFAQPWAPIVKWEDRRKLTVFGGERFGYSGLHKYYNELAEDSGCDWLMLWNDDAIMETDGWDELIHQHGGGLKVLNLTGKLNLFPVISGELYETLGHMSLQAHCDSWLQVVGRLTGIEEDCPLQIAHTPRESYETSKDFFSSETFAALQADIDKVKDALKRQPVCA